MKKFGVILIILMISLIIFNFVSASELTKEITTSSEQEINEDKVVPIDDAKTDNTKELVINDNNKLQYENKEKENQVIQIENNETKTKEDQEQEEDKKDQVNTIENVDTNTKEITVDENEAKQENEEKKDYENNQINNTKQIVAVEHGPEKESNVNIKSKGEKNVISIIGATKKDCGGYRKECKNGNEILCVKYEVNCQGQDIIAETIEEVEIKDDKIYVNNKEIKIMPNTASETAIEKLKMNKDVKIELKDTGKPSYEIEGKKLGKILGLFEIEMPVKIIIDAEDGDIENIDKPWWSFLVKEKDIIRGTEGATAEDCEEYLEECNVGNELLCEKWETNCENTEEDEIYFDYNFKGCTSSLSKAMNSIQLSQQRNSIRFHQTLNTYCGAEGDMILQYKISGNNIEVREILDAESISKCICPLEINGQIDDLEFGTYNVKFVFENVLLNEINVLDEKEFELVEEDEESEINHDFGSCKSIFYGGDVKDNINFVLIPGLELKDEEEESISYLSTFFDDNQEYSFFSVYPFNEHKNDINFFYLEEYDYLNSSKIGEEGYGRGDAIKDILKEKCPVLSENIYQIITISPLNIGFGTEGYSKTVSKIGGNVWAQPYKSGYLNELQTGLHEIGHSLGALDEGYGKSFIESNEYEDSVNITESWFNDNSNLPANWDIEGCPKWCSGQINTNSQCYEEYINYKDCLLSNQTKTRGDANNCLASFTEMLNEKGINNDPYGCDFGLNCIGETNCWLVGLPFFRAYDYNIMAAGQPNITNDQIFGRGYGPTGGEQIKKHIETIKQWNYNKQNLNQVNLELINGHLYNFDNEDRIYIEFGVSDSQNNRLQLFTDLVLDDVIHIKYEEPNSNIESNTISSSFKINDYGNYYYKRSNPVNPEKPIHITELNYTIEIKLPNFKNSWEYNLIAESK